MALSSMNLAIFLCCLWGIAFTWYYSDLAIGDFWAKRVRTIYLYRNTICFGISLVLWGGLWACFPYTSRHISWLRKIMPRFLLNDMIRASQASLLDFAMVFVPNAPSSLRQYPVALFLSLIRWGIVIGVMFFVFIVNPSRTAQLAIIFGYGTILMAWNLKKGILVTFCILFPFAALLGYSSETFETKSKMTFYDLISFQKAVQSQEELDNFIKDNQDRLSITASLFPDLREKPLLGHGMEKAVKIVNDRTAYNDPHCEFVYIQLQHGAIGLTCFLLWILSLFVVPFRYPLVWKQFGLFMAVLIGMDCVFNNAMSYHRETYLLCISVALIAVIRPKRDFSSTKKNIVR